MESNEAEEEREEGGMSEGTMEIEHGTTPALYPPKVSLLLLAYILSERYRRRNRRMNTAYMV